MDETLCRSSNTLEQILYLLEHAFFTSINTDLPILQPELDDSNARCFVEQTDNLRRSCERRLFVRNNDHLRLDLPDASERFGGFNFPSDDIQVRVQGKKRA